MDTTQTQQSTTSWPLRRIVAACLLALGVLGAAALVFLPIGWKLNRFIVWLYYSIHHAVGFHPLPLDTYEFLLNAAMFAVPAGLAVIVWPQMPWWVWVVAGVSASAGVEVIQLRFLERDPSVWDVLFNGLGAFVGAVAGKVFNDLRERKQWGDASA